MCEEGSSGDYAESALVRNAGVPGSQAGDDCGEGEEASTEEAGVSHTRGVLRLAKFCPWCGVANIERDYSRGRKTLVEFICKACGVGWRLDLSRRVMSANHLLHESRRQRPLDSKKDKPKEFRTIAKRKYEEFTRIEKSDWTWKVVLRMRAWIESEEAQELRRKCQNEDRNL